MTYLIKILLCSTSALLVVSCYPPLDLSFLAPLAWLPFFVSLNNTSRKAAVVLGFLHGILVFTIGASWLFHLFHLAALLLWAVLASFSAIWAWIFVSIPSSITRASWLAAAIGGLTWIGVEFFRSELFCLYFPWFTPGMAMSPSHLSPIVGTYGVGFLIVFTSLLISNYKRSSASAITGAVLTSLLLSCECLPFLRPTYSSNSPRLSIFALQNETGTLESKLQQTKESLAQHTPPDFILWPELAIQDPESSIDTPYPKAHVVASQFCSIFITGTKLHRETGFYNAAAVIQGNKLLGEHFKNYPIPIFNDGTASSVAKSIATPVARIGVPICYDCDHYNVVRNMTVDGAQVILCPNLDAAHWSNKQHLQHAQFFQHRAAENHRWIATAASSGVTQTINPVGQQTATIPTLTEGSLVSTVQLHSELTFYSRYGYLFGPICFYLTAPLVLYFLPLQLYQDRKNIIHFLRKHYLLPNKSNCD